MAKIQAGDPEAAWDLFIERYRRLIFAAIRFHAKDYDDASAREQGRLRRGQPD